MKKLRADSIQEIPAISPECSTFQFAIQKHKD
jgi:hypothetical protein